MSELLGIGSRVKHPAFGDGVIVKVDVMAYKVSFITYGMKDVGKSYEKWEIIEKVNPIGGVTFNDAEKALLKILRTYNAVEETVDLGSKWVGGTMSLQPKDQDLKAKEIPIEGFFHKIIMVRDRLRVMEQRVNTSNLSDEEKVNLQQYITRIYGSLTTFNVLFENKDDQFKGAK
ncbi:MAG: hypothetical protein ACI94Y_002117 [Maribacter sp.]|jgi:hypothetical protein